MPFSNPIPRAFTPNSITREAPLDGGVYGISNAREWLFIGSTDNIRQALAARLQEQNTFLARSHPLGFVYEACEASIRDSRCRQLIAEYAPLCNRADQSYSPRVHHS